MRNPNLIENLEARRLMAGTPVISAGPNTLYFNAAAPTNGTDTYQLRVQNTGTGRLLLTDSAFRVRGTDAADFKVLDFPSGGRSIAPGAQIAVTVQFKASSGQNLDIKTAMLRIQSNDPKHQIRFVPLRALPTAGEGGSLEPSLQKVLNLFNLGIDSGETDVNNYVYPATPSATSDEVDAETFVKAGAGNVTIAPLAVFTNKATPAVRMGIYTPGQLDSEKYTWYVNGDYNQTVNPFIFGATAFDPGSKEFGLVTQYPYFYNDNDNSVRNVYSERALNATFDSNTAFNHMRFYPYKDSKGRVVANSYIVAEEEVPGSKAPSDNNDLIYIVTNVKPATGTPTISTQNLAGYPDDTTLSFNKVQTPNADSANITRLTNTLRVRNSGTVPLVISTAITGDYSITSGAATNVSIAAGAYRDIKITFTATGDTAIHGGQLTITSNDPAHPTTAIGLLGNWQQYSEYNPADPNRTSVEPSAAKIINQLLGYTTVIPNANEIRNYGQIEKKGDEVDAQYFTAADSGAQVRVTEVATFHNQTYTDSTTGDEKPTSSFMQWYQKGSPNALHTLLQDVPGEGQMVLPLNNVGVVANGHFINTGTFGFAVERNNTLNPPVGEYSDYSLNTNTNNDPNFGQFLRFFPAYDKSGVIIPNTYFMLHDYNRPPVNGMTTTNYDFQDNVYLISNIVPEGEVKSPVTVNAFRTASNEHRITFSSPTDGPRVTGFNVYRSTTPRGTYTLLNSAPLAARPSTIFTDGTADENTVYYYAVTSVGTGGTESGQVVVSV